MAHHAGNGRSRDTVDAEYLALCARIICEEDVLDYRVAASKAAQRLGLHAKAPDGLALRAAVIDYQRLFGGAAYAERLQGLRKAALQAMRLLAHYEPRLVGGAATGAITRAHRVQLHVFADKAEELDIFLENRQIAFTQGDRDYRYANGTTETVPLARFEAGAIGVDLAIFAPEDLRRPPLSPADGLPMKRLTLAQAETLAAEDTASILAGLDSNAISGR